MKCFRFQAQNLITAALDSYQLYSPTRSPIIDAVTSAVALLRQQWTQARFKATLDLDWSAFNLFFVMHDSDDSHRDGVVFEGALFVEEDFVILLELTTRDRRRDSHLTMYCISKDLLPYTPILSNDTATSSVEELSGDFHLILSNRSSARQSVSASAKCLTHRSNCLSP